MTLGVKGGEQSGQGHGGWLYRLGRRRELVPDCPWLVSRVSARGGRRSRANCCPAPIYLIIDTGRGALRSRRAGLARATPLRPEAALLSLG